MILPAATKLDATASGARLVFRIQTWGHRANYPFCCTGPGTSNPFAVIEYFLLAGRTSVTCFLSVLLGTGLFDYKAGTSCTLGARDPPLRFSLSPQIEE
jgi:hypothetical protein